MSSFIHFILNFRDWCKDYYSKLVVHSQFKITLSPIKVQAFLSQSICLLTNNSNCKLTYSLFLCLTYILAQTHEKKHDFIRIMHSIQNVHNTNFHKKIKVFHCNIIKVKSNCSICFKTSIIANHRKYKYIIINGNQNCSKQCTKTNIVIIREINRVRASSSSNRWKNWGIRESKNFSGWGIRKISNSSNWGIRGINYFSSWWIRGSSSFSRWGIGDDNQRWRWEN